MRQNWPSDRISGGLVGSLFLFVEGVDILGDVGKLHAAIAVVLADGLGLVREDVHAIALHLFAFGFAHGASKEVLVLLLGEVHVIVSVRMRELCWVPAVILVERVRAELRSIFPSLELQVRD